MTMAASIADWTALSTRVPWWYFRCQEASGSLLDDVQDNAAALAPTGSPSYRVTYGADADYWIQLHETATEGFGAAAGAMFSINSQAVVTSLDFRVLAPSSATRILQTLSNGNCYVSVTSTSRIRIESDAGLWFGTYNYDDGAKHPLVVEWIPGAGVLGHLGAGLFRFSTDKEQITGTWVRIGDGIKGIGGSGAYTPPPWLVRELIVWGGTDAEYVSGTQTPKTLCQARGYTVTGY